MSFGENHFYFLFGFVHQLFASEVAKPLSHFIKMEVLLHVVVRHIFTKQKWFPSLRRHLLGHDKKKPIPSLFSCQMQTNSKEAVPKNTLYCPHFELLERYTRNLEIWYGCQKYFGFFMLYYWVVAISSQKFIFNTLLLKVIECTFDSLFCIIWL